MSGEYVLPVPPLGLPPAHGGLSLDQLQQNEAVSLFVERARSATGAFELTSLNDSAVAEVCRRLDGLPLAIELAAVRTRVLSPEQILARLSDRFALLTGGARAALPRQQTLRTTIDWSHDLLNPGEQRLLRRLCVFAGRFTLDDIDAVCVWDDDSGPVLDQLSSLVDKSLVTRQDLGGITGFRLHETMRAYAAGKVRDAAEDQRAGRPVRRVLPDPDTGVRGRLLAPPARLAVLGEAGDRQHLPCPAEMPGRLRLAAWARHRDGDSPLLVHARDPGRQTVARPAARLSR